MRWMRFVFLGSKYIFLKVIKAGGYKYSSLSLRHQICVFSVEQFIIVILFIMKLVLHLLILSLFSGASAEVVEDFEKKCGDFFAINKSPTKFNGSHYKQICQTLNGVPYYATFYDTENRIPVYSAYRFKGHKECNRPRTWFIEPQLEGGNISSMGLEEWADEALLGLYQALDKDYVNNKNFQKGHLAPVYQTTTQGCAQATFTLTNAAPQDSSFNQGRWRVVEKSISDYLVKNCPQKTYSAYIVTGVVPGTGNLNNRVNVPGYFWTAYCCLDKKNKCTISRGVIGENKWQSTIIDKTVEELERELTDHYGANFELFDKSTKPKKIKTGY